MENKIDQIKEIVYNGLAKLAEEENISEFKKCSMTTNIRKHLDSMGVVALSVDLEEMYEETFDKNVKILNEDEPDFMDNFETVETLVTYIESL